VRHPLDAATEHLDPPFAAVDLDAFDANAADLLRRARGKPVRLASKSVRCRALAARAHAAGLQGTLAFTLREALWLDEADVVVAYPTTDSAALRELATAPEKATVMVDCREHLDLLEGPIRVCIDVDASWRPLGGRVRSTPPRRPPRWRARSSGAGSCSTG
jgi:D-serine deaminase-like pyridoxal phosphate-dependent protein